MFTLRQIKRVKLTRSINFDTLKSYGHDIKSKTDDMVEASFESTLYQAIKLVKSTEQRIIYEKLDHVEISVSMNIGLLSVTLSKKIKNE